MAAAIEVRQHTATSASEVTTVKPGEKHVQHDVKLLGLVPIYRLTLEPLIDGSYVAANTYFGAFRSGVTRRAFYNSGEDESTLVNKLRLQSVDVRLQKPRRQTYSVL